MWAFKGFNSRLQATKGKGVFQFEAGKTYEEEACKCARNGFHCAEDPLCAMEYYSGTTDRYFVVKAEGDINQDGGGTRISCTKLTLVKELTKIEMAAQACRYLEKHPERTVQSRHLYQEEGLCGKNDFIIVRGKHPKAAGETGAYIFLVQEKPGSRQIKTIYPFYVDGEEIKKDTYYELRGEKLCIRKN